MPALERARGDRPRRHGQERPAPAPCGRPPGSALGGARRERHARAHRPDPRAAARAAPARRGRGPARRRDRRCRVVERGGAERPAAPARGAAAAYDPGARGGHLRGPARHRALALPAGGLPDGGGEPARGPRARRARRAARGPGDGDAAGSPRLGGGLPRRPRGGGRRRAPPARDQRRLAAEPRRSAPCASPDATCNASSTRTPCSRPVARSSTSATRTPRWWRSGRCSRCTRWRADDPRLLRHHADLLRQRGAPHRPHLHDRGRRHPGPLPPARRGADLLPDRHRRARREDRRGGPRVRNHAPGGGRPLLGRLPRHLGGARLLLRPLHPHHGSRPPRSGAADPAEGLRRRGDRLPRVRGPLLRGLRALPHRARHAGTACAATTSARPSAARSPTTSSR